MDVYARVLDDGTGHAHTLLVSAKRDSNGTILAAGDGISQNPNLSHDNVNPAINDDNSIAYESTSSNLLVGDSDANGAKSDIFVVSLTLDSVQGAKLSPNDLVSRNSARAQSVSTNFDGFFVNSTDGTTPRYLSGDGRWVVFHGRPCDWLNELCPARDDSLGLNRCPGNCSSSTPYQVYLRDRTGTSPRTWLISKAVRENPPGSGNLFFQASNLNSIDASVNSDGLWVAYASFAKNLRLTGIDTENFSDVYLIRTTGTTGISLENLLDLNGNPNNAWRVSEPRLPTLNPDKDSFHPVISCKLTGVPDQPLPRVVFVSGSTVLIPDDTNGKQDVYMRDFRDETPGTPLYFRFSVDSSGAQSNDNSFTPDATCDCRVVTYYSTATNLVPGDTNALPDIFETLSPQGDFVRGDANADDFVDNEDVSFIRDFLFFGGPTPVCLDAADANNNGVIDVVDIAFLNNFVQNCHTNPPPPAPFPNCGPDTVADALTCSVGVLCLSPSVCP